MAYGDPLGITLPTVLGTPGAEAAALINTAIRTCADRLESQVTVAGLDINADLSLQSGVTPFGLVDVHRVSFYDQASALSAVTYPQALYAVGSDLYFNDDAGNQVRIVTGGGVDVSVAGGITGAGYGVSGVEVNWDGTNYKFKSGSGADAYTSVVVDDVLLRDASGNAIRLAAPAGMAADYTATLPGAVPAANSVLVMTTAGVISHSTSPAALTIANNGHVTVSGTGQYKHGSRFQVLPFNAGHPESATWIVDGANALTFMNATSGASMFLPVVLDAGKQITDITVYVRGDAVNRLTVTFWRSTFPGGAPVSIGSWDSTASAVDQSGQVFSGTHTILSTRQYWVEVALRGGSAADGDLAFYSLVITYNEP